MGGNIAVGENCREEETKDQKRQVIYLFHRRPFLEILWTQFVTA